MEFPLIWLFGGAIFVGLFGVVAVSIREFADRPSMPPVRFWGLTLASIAFVLLGAFGLYLELSH